MVKGLLQRPLWRLNRKWSKLPSCIFQTSLRSSKYMWCHRHRNMRSIVPRKSSYGLLKWEIEWCTSAGLDLWQGVLSHSTIFVPLATLSPAFKLAWDTSCIGIGGVLSQESHYVAYLRIEWRTSAGPDLSQGVLCSITVSLVTLSRATRIYYLLRPWNSSIHIFLKEIECTIWSLD